MNYLNLKKARAVYNKGENVTEFLRREFRESKNSSEIIEISYDLQAGSYIDLYENNRESINLFADELSTLLSSHIKPGYSVLDVGTGEMTTLSRIVSKLPILPTNLYAFDISWSRLNKGVKFFQRSVQNNSIAVDAFVADMKQIPLADKSIDIVTSVHALEPNGNNLPELLAELFRVCKNKCVLFEPSYELNSKEGKKRMDKLGYIKGLEQVVTDMGGTLLDVKLVGNTGNPLNPTAQYVVEPPPSLKTKSIHNSKFTVPGTDLPLINENNFFASADTGLVFPILNGIPILKQNAAILASDYFE